MQSGILVSSATSLLLGPVIDGDRRDPSLLFADMIWSTLKILASGDQLDALEKSTKMMSEDGGAQYEGVEGECVGLVARLAEIEREAADRRLTVAEARQVFLESYNRFLQPVPQEHSQDIGHDAYDTLVRKIDGVWEEVHGDIAVMSRGQSSVKRKLDDITDNFFVLHSHVDELHDDVRGLKKAKQDAEERINKVKANFFGYSKAQAKNQDLLLGCFDAIDKL
ncbi:hypothetical protein CPB84DRAFT_1752734 [Gymnopilus junonius]|uniref:Uncharacterized protein n=1 Tax=Gymnopilus junonius TaxID=109634 RepID=A0A9P5NB58_GYMJU|nr:hypothetical protein CPB84DRAFT_1752734 [Gymnopilus junonius]